jgi:hypothetical protein
MTLNPKDIRLHLCEAFDEFIEDRPSSLKWKQLQDSLLDWIRQVQPAIAFDGLLLVLERETRYQYQWLSGNLLLRAKISCLIDVDEFISRVAPNLNASAETVPKYLGSTFSVVVVLETLNRIRSATKDDRLVRGIDSMRYHLGEHPGASNV